MNVEGEDRGERQKEIVVLHFSGFICLVWEVLFLRMGKGRKLKTEPPTLESQSVHDWFQSAKNEHRNELLRETSIDGQR